MGFLRHDLLDQTVEGLYACGVLTSAEDPGLLDVPGGQVGDGPFALVLVLETRR